MKKDYTKLNKYFFLGTIIILTILGVYLVGDLKRDIATPVFAMDEEIGIEFDTKGWGLKGDKKPEIDKVDIIDPKGKQKDHIFKYSIEKSSKNKYSLFLKSEQAHLSPGKYYLEANFLTPKGIRKIKQEFYWGVLALNANKSIYEKGEKAYLQFGALDDHGDTLCGALLNFKITTPGKSDILLNNYDEGIINNPECGPNNVIDTPDYYSYINLDEVGIYQFELTAITENGTRTIQDFIEVADTLPYSIERIGPTRIWPWEEYDMKIKIKASDGWTGDFIETVPANFYISNVKTEKITTNDLGDGRFETITEIISPDLFERSAGWGRREILWSGLSVNPNEELVLNYTFDAPDVSPEFYLLGPAIMTTDDILIFNENRFWQIAGDADTGWKDPTAAGDDYNEWTSPTNAYSSDNADASGANHSFFDEQDYYNFTLGVPAGAIIDGIQVDIEAQANTQNLDVKLSWDGGASQTSAKTNSITVTEQYYTFGGSTDTWSRSWSDNDFSNTNFRVYGHTNGTINIDHVRVKVFYTENATPTITSVSDYPNNSAPGDVVWFSTDWNDTDAGENIKVKVCKTDSLTGQDCTGGHWASSTAFTTSDPEEVSYTVTGSDVGTNNYYVFVCDDGNSCSSSSSGTFTVASTKTYTIGTDTLNVDIISVSGNTGEWTINLSGSPNLSSVSVNDELTDEAVSAGSWKITAVDDGADTLTVIDSEGNGGAPSAAGSTQATISRWYTTIGAWETARDGDLVTRGTIEKGEAYNDGTYAENVTFDGSTTNSTHYMWLTVPSGERHNGTAGTGVKIDPSSSGHAFYVRDQYTVIEWFEITGLAGTSDEGIRLGGNDNEANYTSLKYLLIHDLNTTQQDGIYTGIWDVVGVSVENTIIYDIARAGIHMQMYQDPNIDQDLNLRNVTIYNTNTQNDGGAGILIFASDSSSTGVVNATNTLVMTTNNSQGDFEVAEASGTQTFNLYNCISSDTTADNYNGLGNLVDKVVTNQFVSLTGGSEDLHLKSGSDAIDAGLDSSSYFTDDIDGDTRSGTWDVGADEYIAPPNSAPTITSVNDTPDPVTAGNDISFPVDWNDIDAGDLVNGIICKTDSITTSTLTCPGGSWASSTAATTTDPITISYTTSESDVGIQNFYAFACDDSNDCSASTSGTFTVNSSQSDSWCTGMSSWQKRRKITFDNSSQASDLSSFPAAVVLDSNRIDYDSTLNSGEDIRFCDSDNSTELLYEIEDWNESGTSTVWVKVPQIDGATSTDHIWMYYDNTGATDNSTTTGVWDSNYKMVWHMSDASGAVQDSTSNNMDSTASASISYATTSPLSKGIGFADGYTTSYLRRSTDAIIQQDPFTWEMWFEINALTDTTYWLWEMNGGQFDLNINDGTSYDFQTDHDSLTPTYTRKTDAGFNFAVNTWYHVVATKYTTGNDRVKVYKDGALFYEDGGTNQPSGTISWGNFDIGYHRFGGRIDEVRISSGTRSADWIAFEYCNMTGTCMTYGAEEPQNDPPTITSVTDYPDSVNASQIFTFSVDWNDPTDQIVVHSCKTDAFSTTTYTCTGGSWCDLPSYTTSDPAKCLYIPKIADSGANNYYVFVCDDDGSCSTSTSGTFTVNVDSNTGINVKGMLNIKGLFKIK